MTPGPILKRIPTSRSKVTLMAIVAGLALAASEPLMAQTNPAPAAGPISSPREGNIYDFKKHQPTEAEVGGGDAKGRAEVEKEVQDLLKQLDELDRKSEEGAKGH